MVPSSFLEEQMASIFVAYSPTVELDVVNKEDAEKLEIKQALMDLPDGLSGRDVYEIARRLAELLLEQLD